MKSSHEVLFPKESLEIEDIILVVSDVSERYWDAVEALRKNNRFSDTDIINLANRIDFFKDKAVEASANLSTSDELEKWVRDSAGVLDRLIQRAARLLSSHGHEPFASDLHEWYMRLKGEDIKESEECERFEALTLETLSAVASVPGLLPDGLRKEAAVLVEETRRLHMWEETLAQLACQVDEGAYSVRDVSDLLGYIAECSRIYCHGNLRSFLRMINFSPDDFLNLADACHADALDGSEVEVVDALLKDFLHFLERMRMRFLTRLREMWKVPSPKAAIAA